MSVRVSKYLTGTDENVVDPSQLSDSVFDIPGVSNFINNRQKNVFSKRLETRSSTKVSWKFML